MDKKDFLFVGFVSFCPPSEFDEDLARKYTKEILGSIDTQYPNINKVLVSGLVNVGGLKIGYEEARNLDWLTMGIACEKAYDFKDDWFPVELTPVIVGKVWGEESDHF